GAMNWNRGTITAGPAGAGTTIVNSGGTLTIFGTLNKTISHYSLTNAGTGSWSGIGNLLAESATFNNTGSFSVQTTARWQDTSTGSIFTNSGILNVGASTGPLNIFGNFTQTSASQLNIDLGGTAAGAFDTLAITGTATLAGTLNLSLINGFVPSVGNTFQIITVASITGTFDTVLGADAAPSLLLAPQYNAANVTVLTQATSTHIFPAQWSFKS